VAVPKRQEISHPTADRFTRDYEIHTFTLLTLGN